MFAFKLERKSSIRRYLFVLLQLISICCASGSPSLEIQGCVRGNTVKHDSNYFRIQSSWRPTCQIDCVIHPFNASNTFLSFQLAENTEQPIVNSSVQIQQMHVSVTDELGQLLLRRDITITNTTRTDVFNVQVCPSAVFSKNTRYRIRIQGTVRFFIIGKLDNRLIAADQAVNVNITPQNDFDMQTFTINEEDVSTRVFNITVKSEDKNDCVLVVSQDCLEVQQNSFVHYSYESAVKLTFEKFGRITLSKSSKPAISEGFWYIGIFPKSSSTFIKNITLSASAGSKYDFIPVLYMTVISIVLGVGIAVFSHIFLNRTIEPQQLSCKSCMAKKAGQDTPIDDDIKELYIPSPVPIIDIRDEKISISSEQKQMLCPFCKKWLKVIVRRWFGKGEKTFSYTTGIVCITLLIGTVQFLIANWSDMIDDGNRDVCYYNEACYHPPVQADFPLNLILSNLPYIINGFILAFSMSFREAMVVKDDLYLHESAESQDLSIAYALAWTLVFEGLFSGFYHLCPSRLTFQFDSAFMFVISGLVIIALFNEHLRKCRCQLTSCTSENSLKPIKAPKYFLFFVCPILILNYIGSLKNTKGLSDSGDVIFYMLLVFWLCAMYFWVGYRLDIFKLRSVSCSSLLACKLCMMYILLPAGIITMGIVSSSDWSSFFLFTSIIASGLAIIASIITDILKGYTKFHDREGRGHLAYFLKRISSIVVWLRVLFIFVLTACWCVAIYYFQFIPVTDKTLQPSLSRNLNKPCLVWGFFDAHDLWHFYSAFGLLMGTYLLLFYA